MGMSPLQMKTWLEQPRVGTILALDHPATVEIARDAGWDWLWLDAEHGRFNERNVADACAITQPSVPTFIRVPDGSETTLKRYLDAGADGIIVPQVSSVEEVRAIVKAAIYPPTGQRSVGIARAHGYGKRFNEYLQQRSYVLVVQIETLEGVAAVSDIVHEAAVDAVIIGPYDLSGSCGVPGDVMCDQVQGAIARVLAACQGVDKPCGIFAATAEAARRYLQQGFTLIAVGIDAALFATTQQGLRQTLGNKG